MNPQDTQNSKSLSDKSPSVKWAAGALAAASTISGAHGFTTSIVEISMTGNQLTSTTNSLFADFSGDGVPDFTIGGVNQSNNPNQPFFSNPGFYNPGFSNPGPNGRPSSGSYIPGSSSPGTFTPGHSGTNLASMTINGLSANASNRVSSLGAPVGSNAMVNGAPSDGLIPITFTDPNYGGEIHGWLDVSAEGASTAITLQRIIWDSNDRGTAPSGVSALDRAYETASPVPEPSGLALLALGAGGLLTRRQRKSVA